VRDAAVALCVSSLLATPLPAEDERGRWSFSFGPGVQSTFDDIRSNAAVVGTRESVPDQPPDGDLSNDQVLESDPRTDDLLARQTKVEEKQRLDFSVAYGLTSWLSLQLDSGYYRGDIAPLDTMIITNRWVEVGPNPEAWTITAEQISTPITVGELTQIPISINAVARFRKDSPFNPFIGVGVGYMFNDLEQSQSFQDLNQRILTGFSRVMKTPEDRVDELINWQVIRPGGLPDSTAIYDVDCTEAAGNVASTDLTFMCSPQDPYTERFAALPTQPFVQARVNDSFMYQLSVGADYHFSERWSAYFAARYVVSDAQVEVKIEGVNEAGTFFSIDEGTFMYLADTNPMPLPEARSENRFLRVAPGVSCDPATCRKSTLQERVLVQGGEIDLSAFTVGAGIKFTF
jgi:outer membrane protein W